MNSYQKPEGSFISYMSNLVKQQGGINLAQGIPGFNPPIELLEILASIAKDNIHQYAPGNGNNDLLDLLVEHYKKFNFNRDDFLIVNGATEAITLLYVYLLNIIDNSFSTLAFDPVYETYKNLPKIFNTNFVSFVFEENGSINFNKLQSTIKENNVKLVIINSPGNPYGKVWTKEEFDRIIELSVKLDFYIILDSVYQDLYFEKKPYLPLEKFNRNIFYVNSFSKKFSITGWRVGYLIAHKQHMSKIKSIHDYTGLCSPSVLQCAIAEYVIKYDFGKDYIAQLRENLILSFNILKKELLKLDFYIPEIEGGYFIWARLPKNCTDGIKFTYDLYEKEKVAVIPGNHFSDNFNNYIRFNIARPEDEIRMAVERLNKFFR
ncbi:MAG: pyridoxal phosphate-dependent aminotransferase [Bacteroidales bacterium]|nr:pyridoxal phosphate-dependent aminotransferase [Bacteroidales bacterium]